MFSTSPLRRTTTYAVDVIGIVSNPSAGSPFISTLLASGTFNAPASGVLTKDHPGVTLIRSSTTTNSGARMVIDSAAFLLGGGEQYDAVIWTAASFTSTTVRLGFLDTIDHNAPVDGAWLEFSGSGVLSGKTSSNSTVSTTGTTTTLAASTWYHLRIKVNAAGTQVDFTVYSDAGAVVWTANLATNIPTAAGRECGAGIVATNSGTTATDLLAVDFQQVKFSRALIRGALT